MIDEIELQNYNEETGQIEVAFAEIQKDCFFGDSALVEGNKEKRLYSLWAAQDCHLFSFTKVDFKEMLKKQEQRIL